MTGRGSGRTTEPGIGTGTEPGTGLGPGWKTTRVTSAQEHAMMLVSRWYAEPDPPTDEELMAPVEDNEGVSDEEIPDGILDDWDDDTNELPRESDPEHRLVRRTPNPMMTFWPIGAGVGWEIRPIPRWMADDPLLLRYAEAHAARLEATAEALTTLQRDTLLAPTLGKALRRLKRLTKTQIAEVVGVESKTGSKISRDRHAVVVEMPSGLVPLDFFFYASMRRWEATMDAICVADELLRTDPGRSANSIGETVAARTGAQADAIRKLIPALKAVRARPEIVARHRRAFPRTSWQALRSDLGLTGDDRAKPVVCLALVETIGPPTSTGGDV